MTKEEFAMREFLAAEKKLNFFLEEQDKLKDESVKDT